jgi:DNA mismatch endonuclease (patch repair protein)
MADFLSKQKRSELMAKVKSKNTKLELDFIRLLSAEIYPRGFRYRKHSDRIFGHPDVAFIKQKIAIFIDSEFWHGQNFKKSKKVLKTDFWLNKIEKNIARDKKVNTVLRKDDWKVLRFWGKQLKIKPEMAIAKILQELNVKY